MKKKIILILILLLVVSIITFYVVKKNEKKAPVTQTEVSQEKVTEYKLEKEKCYKNLCVSNFEFFGDSKIQGISFDYKNKGQELINVQKYTIITYDKGGNVANQFEMIFNPKIGIQANGGSTQYGQYKDKLLTEITDFEFKYE